MQSRYVNRDVPRQYMCLILELNGYVDTIYIYAYTIREAIEILNKIQNLTRIIDIWEVK